MRYTLQGWKTTAASRLIYILPLQSFASSLAYVETYLSSVGGWVPDDLQYPTGDGEPANGERPEEAATSILTQREKTVYRVSGKVTVELDYDLCVSLASGLSDVDVINQSQIQLFRNIQNQLRSTTFNPVSIVDMNGNVADSANTSATDRVGYNNWIRSHATDINPLVVALRRARTLHNLSENWNVATAYTEPDISIAVIIKKYTNTSYTTLDGNSEHQYIVNVGPVDYKVTGGVVGNTIQ